MDVALWRASRGTFSIRRRGGKYEVIGFVHANDCRYTLTEPASEKMTLWELPFALRD